MDSVLIDDAFSNSFSPRTPSSGAWVQDLRQDLNLNKKSTLVNPMNFWWRNLWPRLFRSQWIFLRKLIHDFLGCQAPNQGQTVGTKLLQTQGTLGKLALMTGPNMWKKCWSKLTGESCSHVIQSSSRACFFRSATAGSTACSVMRWESKISNYQLTWEFKIYPRFRSFPFW